MAPARFKVGQKFMIVYNYRPLNPRNYIEVIDRREGCVIMSVNGRKRICPVSYDSDTREEYVYPLASTYSQGVALPASHVQFLEEIPMIDSLHRDECCHSESVIPFKRNKAERLDTLSTAKVVERSETSIVNLIMHSEIPAFVKLRTSPDFIEKVRKRCDRIRRIRKAISEYEQKNKKDGD